MNQSIFPISSFLIEIENRTDPQINPTDEERRVVVSEDQENFFILSFQTFFSSTFFCSSLADTPIYLRRKEQPSVRRALPPVGWQRTVEQPAQMTTVWACEKTVVIVKQPGHLTSMKKERGAGTRVYVSFHQFRPLFRCDFFLSDSIDYRTLSLCLRASD
jgi:hypothetical protein